MGGDGHEGCEEGYMDCGEKSKVSSRAMFFQKGKSTGRKPEEVNFDDWTLHLGGGLGWWCEGSGSNNISHLITQKWTWILGITPNLVNNTD